MQANCFCFPSNLIQQLRVVLVEARGGIEEYFEQILISVIAKGYKNQ